MTLGFIPTETTVPLPSISDLVGALAALFAFNDPVNTYVNQNDIPAETGSYQPPEGILYDFPVGSTTIVTIGCNAGTFTANYNGPITLTAGEDSQGSPIVKIEGNRVSGVDPDNLLCPIRFVIGRIRNVSSGFDDTEQKTVDDIRALGSQNPDRPQISASVTATVSTDLSPVNAGGSNTASVAKEIKDAVDKVSDSLEDLTRRPGVRGSSPPVSLPDVIEEITINVNADVDRVINAMIELFTAQNNYLSSEFSLLRSLSADILSAVIQGNADTQTRLDTIINLLTEAIPEIQELDLDSIRGQLEAILNRADDIDNDLQLVAGIIRDVLDVVTQVLEEAGEIKRKQKQCEATEEDKEDCCDLIEEIHEIVTTPAGGSFLFSPDCDDQTPQVISWGGAAFGGIHSGLNELGARLDVISRKICDVDAIAAVPEGWNLRPENQRGQLVVQLSVVEDKTIGSPNRQITIPHYSGGQTVPAISYRSGSFYGMLVLADNSKVRVYASSEGEAESVVSFIRAMVSGAMQTGSYIVTGRVRKPIQSHQLVARIAKFYAPGHEPGRSPIWVARVARS